MIDKIKIWKCFRRKRIGKEARKEIVNQLCSLKKVDNKINVFEEGNKIIICSEFKHVMSFEFIWYTPSDEYFTEHYIGYLTDEMGKKLEKLAAISIRDRDGAKKFCEAYRKFFEIRAKKKGDEYE